MLEREELVLLAPHDQRRAVEARELGGSVESVLRVDGLGQLRDVAPDVRVAEGRRHPLLGDLVGDPVLGGPAVGDRRLAHRRRAQPRQGGLDRAGPAGDLHQRPEQLRREVVERVARGQDQRTHPLGPRRHEQLADRPAGVVAHDRDVLEVERLEELGEQRGDRARGQIGGVVHRDGVRSEGQVGADAARPAAGGADDLAPQQPVDHEAVHEDHDWRVRVARSFVAVADRAG